MKGNIKLRASHVNGETAAYPTEVVCAYSIQLALCHLSSCKSASNPDRNALSIILRGRAMKESQEENDGCVVFE
jgi:hypothetical protein